MKNSIVVKLIFFVTVLMVLSSCSQTPQWKYDNTIQFEGITPLGIIKNDSFLYISDSDNNKVFKMDLNGKVIETYENFERPMHIDMDGEKLFIPEYGADTITIVHNQRRSYLPLNIQLDAPASVDVQGDDYLIADFYNHRIVYNSQGKDLTFGKKGKVNGAFHYPTDIQFANNLIYVADAYNNRVQVFDKAGQFKQTIGEEDGMNAATGIYVAEHFIAVTDFENSRILIYDLNGKLLQIIEEHLDKPTDVAIDKGVLYVANYNNQSISVFKLEK